MAYEAGQRIGDYEVVSLLGFGGMGRVYKVRSIISNREEAMKVLLPDFAAEADISARFMAEIRTLAGLDHPNIAQLRTAFQHQNEFVMVMEFVEGTTLETLASTSKIPIDQVVEYSMQVLSALSYAHSRGVIHRDMKPANVMVTSHGLVKLMDFGIAKSSEEKSLTRPGTTMGSVYYISPEQVRGGTVDARSDIYSFGVTLYELLTGKKPFQAETSYSVLYAQMNETPTHPMQVNPEVPAALNDIVMHAIEKNPDARFQTAEDFRNALKAARKLQAEPAVETPGYAPVAAAAAAAAEPRAMSATAAMSGSAPTPQPGYTPVPVPAAAPTPTQPQSGFTPVPAPQPAYTPVAGGAYVAAKPAKSNRGLWLGLGVAAAILALIAVATVLPRVYSIYASEKAAATQAPASQPAADKTAQPGAPATNSPSESTTPGTAPSDATAPASETAGTSGSAPATKAGSPGGSSSRPAYDKTHEGSGSASTASSASDTGRSAAPAGPSPKEIREVRDRLMNMDARADAARSGIQQLRGQQQAQGLDIRSDMLASMNRMNNYLSEANRALGQNDLETANEYLDRANKEISKLESFLGK